MNFIGGITGSALASLRMSPWPSSALEFLEGLLDIGE